MVIFFDEKELLPFFSSIEHPNIVKEFNTFFKDNATAIEMLKSQYKVRLTD